MFDCRKEVHQKPNCLISTSFVSLGDVLQVTKSLYCRLTFRGNCIIFSDDGYREEKVALKIRVVWNIENDRFKMPLRPK